MSRLDDALAALRKAAVGRHYVVVVDACADDAPGYSLRIEGPDNEPPYISLGLLRHAQISIESGCGIAPEADDSELPDTD